MESAPKTWHVPKDPPPDFITNLKRWLVECSPNIEWLSDQELQKLVPDVTSAREWLSAKLHLLHMLEQELRPVEWLAQGLWYEAGKTGPFDFDKLYYTIAGPSDDTVMDLPSQADERLNVHSKLDELLSRTLEANEIADNVSTLIQKPALRLKRLSSAVKLKRSVWALVIGINNFLLHRAVADAEAMSEFLINRLSVPEDHITKLLSRRRGDRSTSDHPTRHNILSKLWSLHKDKRIRHGDTIIVYYAGYGTRYNSGGVLRHGVRVEESDLNWNTFYQRNCINFDGPNSNSGFYGHPLIDAITPVDRGDPDPDPNYLGRRVPDICDRELNTIFSITRQKKGPNIVFIADCSHFAMPIRGTIIHDVGTLWRYRSAMPLLGDSMQEMLLRAQWNIDTYVKDGSSGIRSAMDANWTPDTSSFVTLAACRGYENAREHLTQDYGIFTGVLLDTLVSDAVDKNTTFEGVIQLVAEKLKRWQVPVAHGDRKNSRLWFGED